MKKRPKVDGHNKVKEWMEVAQIKKFEEVLER
jgi:hypothetical protein